MSAAVKSGFGKIFFGGKRKDVDMTEGSIFRHLIMFAIPLLVGNVFQQLYNMVDTYFVGTLGESPQGATGILFALQAVIQAFAFMLGQGSGTMVSKALADKNKKEAERVKHTPSLIVQVPDCQKSYLADRFTRLALNVFLSKSMRQPCRYSRPSCRLSVTL